MEKRRKGKRGEGWRIEAVRKRKMDVETIFTTFDESEGARRASLPPPHAISRKRTSYKRERGRRWWLYYIHYKVPVRSAVVVVVLGCAVLCMVAPYHQRLRRGIIHHLYDTHLHFHISYLHFPSPPSLSLSLSVSFLF